MRLNAPIIVIFTTVLVDLIGFGIVIPLVNLYGVHYGATGLELAILGGIYSLMQFICAPLWGSLSDRIGRRPVLLFSLAGSTCSYLLFSIADSVWLLVLSRALAGAFAANIAAAQAYIADITTPEKRAQGMGLIGAAFGIGFTIGPALGGYSAKHLGLSAPGLIAALICGSNLVLAYFRLTESLPESSRNKDQQLKFAPISAQAVNHIRNQTSLGILVIFFFLFILAFSNFEQSFALLVQDRFGFPTIEAGYRAGLALMWLGIVGIVVQGFLIRLLVPRFKEINLIIVGGAIFSAMVVCFPFAPTYSSLYLIGVLFAFGTGILNPSLTALISKSARADEQGSVLGLTQGIGSLARTVGPPIALLSFGYWHAAPAVIASILGVLALLMVIRARNSFVGQT